MNPEKKISNMSFILAVINKIGGEACIKDIEKCIFMPASSISGRINELIEAGYVSDNGKREVRHGMLRKIFQITDEGRKVAVGIEILKTKPIPTHTNTALPSPGIDTEKNPIPKKNINKNKPAPAIVSVPVKGVKGRRIDLNPNEVKQQSSFF